jgi:hypothetical protein
VIGTSLVVVGVQNALGGFLLAILNGNEAEFLREPEQRGEAEAGERATRPVMHAVSR